MSKPKRRNFTIEYNLGALREADRCKAPGEAGALLRQEGLYSSQLCRWRLARERGELAGHRRGKRGPQARPVNQRDKRNLEARLARAEGLIEAQKKCSAVWDGSEADGSRGREELMEWAREVGAEFGIGPTCDVLGIPRFSFYQWLRAKAEAIPMVWSRAAVASSLRRSCDM